MAAGDDASELERLVLEVERTSIFTYDDILNRLVVAQARAVGLDYVSQAVTWSMKLRVSQLTIGRANYLVDHLEPNGDGWSVFFDANGQLTLRVLDTSGSEFSTKAGAQYPIGPLATLSFIFASSDQNAVLQIAVNGVTVSLHRWPNRIELSRPLREQLDTGRTVIGNSLKGSEGTAVQLVGVAAWSKPLSFLELLELNEEWQPREDAGFDEV